MHSPTLSYVGGTPGNGEKTTSVTQRQTKHYEDSSVPATASAAEQDSVEIHAMAPWANAGRLLSLSVLPKTEPNRIPGPPEPPREASVWSASADDRFAFPRDAAEGGWARHS